MLVFQNLAPFTQKFLATLPINQSPLVRWYYYYTSRMNLFSWLYTSGQKWARGVVVVPLIGPQVAEEAIISVFPCIVLFRWFRRNIPAMSELLQPAAFRNVKVPVRSVLDFPIWINSFVRPWWASPLALRRLVRCWFSFIIDDDINDIIVLTDIDVFARLSTTYSK